MDPQNETLQNYSAVDGLLLRRVSRMTPKGEWVWAWQSEWQLDEVATQGRSIVENDVIQAEHNG